MSVIKVVIQTEALSKPVCMRRPSVSKIEIVMTFFLVDWWNANPCLVDGRALSR